MSYYLSKGFVIIEHTYKQLSIVPNDVKLRIHTIYKKTDYVNAYYTEISSVENTINKLHIQSDLHLIYKQKL